MSEENIQCPRCGEKIVLTEALASQIETTLRAKLDAENVKKATELESQRRSLAKQTQDLDAKTRALDEQVAEKLREERKKIVEQEKAKILAEQAEQTKALEEEIRQKRSQLADAKKNELELRKQQRELEEKAQHIDLEVQQRIAAERSKIVEQEKAKVLAEQSERTKALEEELNEKRSKLIEADKKELGLLKKQTELEEKARSLELEVQRTLAAERKKIVEDASTKAAEEQLLKLRERDDKIEALTKRINDLQRQAEQGSQESQGEALEGALQDSLQQAFPLDLFAEVKKGQKGGDIIQIVRNGAGKECGKILWESKRTKEFSNKWIEKLKSDQQDAGAELAVIVSVALPKEVRGFGLYETMWLSDFASSSSLATALRLVLIHAAREKTLSANQDTLKDVIFQYVTGQDFAMQIRAIADAFSRMKRELDGEKRAMERIWKSREKQIETVIANIGGIHGSLEGYLGSKMLPSAVSCSLDGVLEADQEEDDTKP